MVLPMKQRSEASTGPEIRRSVTVAGSVTDEAKLPGASELKSRADAEKTVARRPASAAVIIRGIGVCVRDKVLWGLPAKLRLIPQSVKLKLVMRLTLVAACRSAVSCCFRSSSDANCVSPRRSCRNSTLSRLP